MDAVPLLVQAPLNIPDDATFDDYLRLAIASDFVTEIPVDPLSMGGGGPTKGKSERAGQAEEVRAVPAAPHASVQPT